MNLEDEDTIEIGEMFDCSIFYIKHTLAHFSFSISHGC